jgi:bacteriocin-like protein
MNEMNQAESQEIETLTDEQLENVDGGDIWGQLFGQIFGSSNTGIGGIFGGSGGFHFP